MRTSFLWFLGRLLAAVALLSGGAASGATEADAESVAWQQAQAINSVEGYQAFLEKHPLGVYSQEAFARLVRLLQTEEEEDEEESRRLVENQTPTEAY